MPAVLGLASPPPREDFARGAEFRRTMPPSVSLPGGGRCTKVSLCRRKTFLPKRNTGHKEPAKKGP